MSGRGRHTARIVAFDMVVDGNTDIYTIGIDGAGQPGSRATRPTTATPSGRATGSGSTTNPARPGGLKIWKVRGGWRTPVQLTAPGRLRAPRSVRRQEPSTTSTRPRPTGCGWPAQAQARVRPLGRWRRARVQRRPRRGRGTSPTRGSCSSRAPQARHRRQTLNPPDVLELYGFADRRRFTVSGSLPFPLSRFGSRRRSSPRAMAAGSLGSHIDRWERDILVADNVR